MAELFKTVCGSRENEWLDFEIESGLLTVCVREEAMDVLQLGTVKSR